MDQLNSLQSAWLVATTSRKVKAKPLGIKIAGRYVVLFRCDRGIVALEDRCPHRNMPLSLGTVEGSTIKCAYHGWRFDHDGKIKGIPGLSNQSSIDKCRIPQFWAHERDGLVWINLDPNASLESLPRDSLRDRDIASHSFVIEAEVEASLCNAIENLLDGFHTPFVHAGLVRTANKTQKMTAHLQASDDRVEIRYSGEDRQSGLISRLFEGKRASSFGRFIEPSIAQLEYRSVNRTELLITCYFSPSDFNCQRLHAVIETPKGLIPSFVKRVVLGYLFTQVLRQDKRILEAQSRNISKFGEEDFVSTRLDLIRPYLVNRLNGREDQAQNIPVERQESFEL